MYSIKKLLLLAVVLGWLVTQPVQAASNEPVNGTETHQASALANILRVDDDSAAGSPDGSSWENAYPTLQDALAAATSGDDEIWVAAGVYYPDEGSGQTDNERTSTFQLANGVAIYGGFAGTETARAERNWESNVTLLSGDIDHETQPDNNKINGIISSTSDIVGSNAYHVVTGSGTDSTAILDGVTINAAQANGGNPNDRGAGMYNNDGSPALTNVNITSNYASDNGGGMHNNSNNPMLTNVKITSNYAPYGGGMFNSLSSPALTNVVFSSNSASNGGGIFSYSSNPTLTNVTFSSNSASSNGGGMMNNNSSNPTLTNVIIWNNQAGGSTGSTSASIYNSSSTATISYSLIANSGGSGAGWVSALGTDGGNNIAVSPLFVMDGDPSTSPPTSGDYRLRLDSPAIDAGNNAADLDGSGADTTTISEITSDLDGNPRLLDIAFVADSGNGTAPIVDMGAYEVQRPPLYVDENSTAPSPNGSSWANAYPKLQDALAAALSGDEIWVAAGVYYPDEGSGQTDNERTSTFQLANGVAIYGGFAGTETARAERDWEINVTVLSGDIDHETQADSNKDSNGIISSTDDIVGSNAYHVVTGSSTDSTAILDGVTINAGRANGSYPDNTGGGMFNDGGSPTLTNVTFSSNSANYHGGGMFNDSSHITLTNVTFSSNSADSHGGGVFNDSSHITLTNVTFSSNSANYGGGMSTYSSNPTLTNVTFSSNSATLSGGGMRNAASSNPTLTNVTFSSNSASYYGGGMYNHSSNPTLTNVTFSSNSANANGGVMYNNSSNPTLTNVIIWNNQANGSTTSTSASIYNDTSTPTISYSLIANSGGSGAGWESALGTDGGNNIDTSPLFVMSGNPSTSPPIDGDYRLQITSPAIDAGNNEADLDGSGAGTTTISEITSDLDGTPRLLDIASVADSGNGTAPIVDMGAYEAQIRLYVDENSTAPSPDGSEWASAYPKLQDALAAATSAEIWVAAGVYYPDEGSGQSNNEPTSTFELANGVAIYGGFAGTERARAERNWESNVTVLSGDIDHETQPDNNKTLGIISSTSDIVGSNAYHVVTGSGTDSTALLDGFTINAGQANGSNPDDRGGGMYNDGGSPTLTNVNITSNYASFYGGGVSNNSSSNPTLTNVNITSNYASFYGGGMSNDWERYALGRACCWFFSGQPIARPRQTSRIAN